MLAPCPKNITCPYIIVGLEGQLFGFKSRRVEFLFILKPERGQSLGVESQ